MRILHTMLRVADPEAAIRFFTLLGLKETRRMENQAGRYTLIYLAADEDFRGDGEQGQENPEHADETVLHGRRFRAGATRFHACGRGGAIGCGVGSRLN